MKRPAFQFYPADWRKDVELRSCSVAARGLWMDMLCIAHECEPYGHLTVNGRAMTPAQIANQVGLSAGQCKALVAELISNGVARQNDEGVIYSKRMVDDEDLRNRRAEGGKAGSEHGHKGAEHGSKGGRPKNSTGDKEPPSEPPLPPPIKPPPSSSSSSSTSVEEISQLSLAPAQPPAEPQADRPALTLVEARYTPPDCPHLEVLAAWAEVLPAMPQHEPALWKGARSDHLRARWRETASAKYWQDQAAGLAYFRKLFAYVGQSAFLTGRAKPRGPDQRPFMVELEWLVKPSNWAKVLEGKYHQEAA